MRILMGIRYLWRGGGTETHVITLANELRRMGHSVAIYTAGGPWVSKARGLGIKVLVDAGLGGTNPRRRQTLLNYHLQKGQFHVLHAHDATCLRAFTQSVGSSRRPKIVFTVHGPYVRPAAIFRARNKANAIIAVSPNIRKSLSKTVSRKMIFTVPNGIDTDVFRSAPGIEFRKRNGIPPNAFVVGYCGRFTFDKVDLGRRVARSLQQLSKRQAGVYCVVAGRGSTRLFASSKRLKVLGHVNQMPSFFNACDVMIGTGRTAMEALFCEVPVIAIGKAGYRGPVTTKNIHQMIVNNFGDHGRTINWTIDTLHRTVAEIHFHRGQFRKQSKFIRQAMLPKLSLRKVAATTLAIYRTV